jgi:hypothetical protein
MTYRHVILKKLLSGAIADLQNRSVRLAAVEPLSAYPDYIAALTEGSCVQVSTGCFFVNDHVSSYRLYSCNCEINAIYTYFIQRQSQHGHVLCTDFLNV